MNWYMNLKIGTKQLLGNLALLTLTTLVGVGALHGLGVVREKAAELAERRFPLTQALSELRPPLFQYRVSEMDYVFTQDPDERDLRKAKMEGGLADTDAALAKLETMPTTQEERKLLDAVKADYEKNKAETGVVTQMVAQKKTLEAEAEETGTANGNFDDLMADIKAAIDAQVAGAAGSSKESTTLYQRTRIFVLGSLLAALLLGVMLTVASSRMMARPVREVSEVAKRIAAGDLTAEALQVQSTDEVGQLAESINTMQKNLQTTISAVKQSSGQIAEASDKLLSVSKVIQDNSQEASMQSRAVSSATEEVNANLDTIATSTEQMSTTIRDIAKNSTEAARVAGEARKLAVESKTIMAKLGISTGKIGNVVKVVTSIAQKTDLLALNATVEAARAGAAGAGFAVVATEVKELAKQTATATGEIAKIVEAIQGDAGAAIDAITRIDTIIGQVDAISTTIAAAVEEQSATTDQMSASIGGAAQSSRGVAENIRQVAAVTQSTSEGTKDLQNAAADLSEMSERLRDVVARFRSDDVGGKDRSRDTRDSENAAFTPVSVGS